MTDQEMSLLQKVSSIRAPTGNGPAVDLLDLIRDECGLPGPRIRALRAELDTHSLERLRARRDRDDQDRPKLDQDIADLERRLP